MGGKSSPVWQVLRLCTEEEGGTISLVSRSDCRKQLRWKSIESDEEASNFTRHAESVAEKPGSGFGCTIEKRHPNGAVKSIRLTRLTPPPLSPPQPSPTHHPSS